MDPPQFIKYPEKENKVFVVNQTATASENQSVFSGTGFTSDFFSDCLIRSERCGMNGIFDPDKVRLMNDAVSESVSACCFCTCEQIC